jgi:hypothetical protein
MEEAPMDRARALILGLLIVWLGTMALSALSLMAEPEGDGFTRGLNRATGFIGWQLAASVVALPLWLMSRRLPKGAALRWLARVPGWCAVALFLLIVIWIAAGLMSSWTSAPVEMVPPGPVTVPVE